MAIHSLYNLKTVVGNSDLTLQAESGKSLLVTGVYVANALSDYVTLITEKTNVGYFRVGGTLGNHLFFPMPDNQYLNLLDLMVNRGWIKGYPVGEGETFRIDGAAQSTARQAVVYVEADAGDFTPDQPNGSRAKDFVYLSYGRYSGTLQDGENHLETPQTPAEFPNFPFGVEVPSKKQIQVLAIAASDVGKTSDTAANKSVTEYLRLIRERETLFDEDRNGLILLGSAPSSDGINVGTGSSVIGNGSYVDRRLPLIFPNPISFGAGEELDVYLTVDVDAGAANIAANEGEIAFVNSVISL